jgi:hypothetical protein
MRNIDETLRLTALYSCDSLLKIADAENAAKLTELKVFFEAAEKEDIILKTETLAEIKRNIKINSK